MIPANELLGIQRDLYFSDEIAIERKASLDELANNLTADRTRFEDEMLRSKDCKVLLMLENCVYLFLYTLIVPALDEVTSAVAFINSATW